MLRICGKYSSVSRKMKHILIITIEIYRFGAKWSSDTFRKYYVFFQEKFAPPEFNE